MKILIIVSFVGLALGCGGGGGSESSKSQAPSPPTASFTVSNANPFKNQSVKFIDTSGSQSRRWTFGDSNSSVEASPTHSYSTAGSFNVTLTVGESTVSKICNVVSYTDATLNFVGVGNVSEFNSTYLVNYMLTSIPPTTFKNVNISSLTGASASLISAHATFLQGTKTVNIFYISTHGALTGVGFNGTLVTWKNLVETLSKDVNGPIIFIISCCDSGMIKDWLVGETCALTKTISDQGTSSWTGNGPYGSDPYGFEAQIVKAFQSRYDPNHDGVLTLGELHSFVSAEMAKSIQRFPMNNYLLPGQYGDPNTVILTY